MITETLDYVLPQNTTQKSISIVFCVSVIRHDSSLSKYRKQKQSPPWTFAIFSISRGGDCFCLRYLLSDESWRIALTLKTMEMDFCVVFCGTTIWTRQTYYLVFVPRSCIFVTMRVCHFPLTIHKIVIPLSFINYAIYKFETTTPVTLCKNQTLYMGFTILLVKSTNAQWVNNNS